MTLHEEVEYADFLYNLVLKMGRDRKPIQGRTAEKYWSAYGVQFRYDISNNILPIVNGKKLHLKSVLVELLWFLRGDTSIDFLKEHGVTIWDEWASQYSNIGPMYGKQWRRWNGKFDQINTLIENIKASPTSRRHVVSAWNVADLPDETTDPKQNVRLGRMALAPCHYSFQCCVTPDGKMTMIVNMRSSDLFLGYPFNVTSYGVLAHLLAVYTGTQAVELVMNLGDAHVYENHEEQVIQYHNAVNGHQEFGLKSLETKLELSPYITEKPPEELSLEDLKVVGYRPFGQTIKAPIAY